MPPRNTSLNVPAGVAGMPGAALERYNDAAHLAE
jgi:hypothetical protein